MTASAGEARALVVKLDNLVCDEMRDLMPDKSRAEQALWRALQRAVASSYQICAALWELEQEQKDRSEGDEGA